MLDDAQQIFTNWDALTIVDALERVDKLGDQGRLAIPLLSRLFARLPPLARSRAGQIVDAVGAHEPSVAALWRDLRTAADTADPNVPIRAADLPADDNLAALTAVIVFGLAGGRDWPARVDEARALAREMAPRWSTLSMAFWNLHLYSGLVYLTHPSNLRVLMRAPSRIDDAALAALPRVTSLGLQAAAITDDGIDALRPLPLRALDLSWTGIGARGLKKLQQLPTLESLDLSFTAVGDEAIDALAALPNLRELSLRGTGVTDAGVARLREFAALRSLDLGGTNVGDDGVAKLSLALERVALPLTLVTQAALPALGALAGLRALDLSKTDVADLTPLAGCAALVRLVVGGGAALPDLAGTRQLTALRDLTVLEGNLGDDVVAKLDNNLQLSALDWRCSARVPRLPTLTRLRAWSDTDWSQFPMLNAVRINDTLSSVPAAVEDLTFQGGISDSTPSMLLLLKRLTTVRLVDSWRDVLANLPWPQLRSVSYSGAIDGGGSALSFLSSAVQLQSLTLFDPDRDVAARIANLNFFTRNRFSEADAVADAKLDAAAMAPLHSCTALTQLALEGPGVDDALVAEVARLTTVTDLRLGWNRVGAQGLRSLGTMPGLRSLSLGRSVFLDPDGNATMSLVKDMVRALVGPAAPVAEVVRGAPQPSEFPGPGPQSDDPFVRWTVPRVVWPKAWAGAQPAFEDAAGALRAAFELYGPEAAMTGVSAWLFDDTDGPAPALHPAFVRAAYKTLLGELSADVLRTPARASSTARGAYAYLQWLAARLGNSSWLTELGVPMLLSLTRATPDFLPADWNTTGLSFFSDVVRPAVEAASARYDGGAHVDELAAILRSETWTSSIWGAAGLPTPIALMRRAGAARTLRAWTTLRDRARARADALTIAPWPPTIRQADLLAAGADADVLNALALNPWCAPSLPTAVSAAPPTCFEAGVLVRAAVARIPCGGLVGLIDGPFQALVLGAATRTLDERSAVADALGAFDALRGRFGTAVLPPGDPPPGPPEAFSDDGATASTLSARLASFCTRPPRALNDEESVALAALAWLGVPRGSECLLRALASWLAAPEVGQADRALLLACRAELAVTSALADVPLDLSLLGKALVGTHDSDDFPGLLKALTDDGRPFCVRAAADLGWLVARTTLLDAPFGVPLGSAIAGLRVLEDWRKAARAQVTSGHAASGLVLGLDGLARDLVEAAATSAPEQVATPPSSDDGFASAAEAAGAGGFGTGPLAASYWLSRWAEGLDRAEDARRLSLNDVAYSQYAGSWIDWLQVQLCGALVFLRGGAPVLPPATLAAVGLAAPWWSASSWSGALAVGTATRANEPRTERLPFRPSTDGAALLKIVIDTATGLEQRTARIARGVDADGLTDAYLPQMSWVGARRGLEGEIATLKDYEGRLVKFLADGGVKSAIETLTPLVAAAVGADSAAANDLLDAALAEVRRTEANLAAQQARARGAQAEVMANELLATAAADQEKRASILLDVAQGRAESAKLQVQIADISSQIALLDKNNAADQQKIDQLQVQRADLAVKRAQIDVKVAARAVEAIENRVVAIKDLIVNPQPHPSGSGMVAGQLGVAAARAEQQIQKQLDALSQQEQDLQHQVDQLREEGCVRSVCSLLGAVIGAFIGGPAGARIGSSVGSAIGHIISDIEEGKPVGQVLGDALSDGLTIARQIKPDLKPLDAITKATGIDLKGALADFEKVRGEILQNLPPVLSADVLARAAQASGLGPELSKLLSGMKDAAAPAAGATDWHPSLREFASVLQKTFGQVAASGPGRDLFGQVAVRAKQVVDSGAAAQTQLVQAARALGIDVAQADRLDADEGDALAKRVALLVVGRAKDEMAASRDRLLSGVMTWSTSVQAKLRKGATTLLDACADLDEEGSGWMQALYGTLPVVGGGELPWGDMREWLGKLLEGMIPDDPETVERLLGRFELQLDGTGAHAVIQELLLPWTHELDRRLAEAQDPLRQPCSDEDDERRVGCQIEHVRSTEQAVKLVLNWVHDPATPERQTVASALLQKQTELEQAKQRLKQATLDLESGKLKAEEAQLVVGQAANIVKIKDLGVAVASLASSQTALALRGSQLEVQAQALQRDIDAARAQAARAKNDVARADLEAAQHAVDAGAADLDRAVAAARAARARAGVFLRLRDWAQSNYLTTAPAGHQPLDELIGPYRVHVERACVYVRELLRILRVCGAKQPTLALPQSPWGWFEALSNASTVLVGQLVSTSLPAPTVFQINLDEKLRPVIEALFSTSGLLIEFVHIDKSLPTPSGGYRQEWNEGVLRFYIASYPNQRVFLAWVLGESTRSSGARDNSLAQWTIDPIRHDAITPVLVRTDAGYEARWALSQDDPHLALDPWEAKLPVDVFDDTEVLARVNLILHASEGIGLASSEEFQQRLGLPLPGRMHLRIGKPPPVPLPNRVLLVFAYSFQEWA